MVAKFMATYHQYRLEDVMAMPFAQFCELYHLIDVVWADLKLEDHRPLKQLILVRDTVMHLFVPAISSKEREREMTEGMRHMTKLRKFRAKVKE